jgi:trimeric autotransporter adhesin
MKNRISPSGAIATAVLMLASIGWAQQISSTAMNTTAVPHLVSYSGILKDGHGKAVAGITGVTFLIYRDAEGGAPVWMETQNVTSDSAGRYTAQLGATRREGLPPETFMTGEARWLAVQVEGAPEQSRVLLVAVPYAMKALDAETVGGLPPSAFMLAVPASAGSSATAGGAAGSNQLPVAPPPASAVTTSGGILNTLPLWTTATNVQSSAITQTGSGATAKIGIGTTTPAAVLDVKGSAFVRGALTLPAIGNATAAAGKNSQPQDFIASSFSSVISTGVNQKFQWQAEPAANDTANPSGTLNLLYGLGATTPAETGLKLAPNGQITFATGQTFPGTGPGTITGVTTASGSGLMGGGTSGNLKVALINTCANKQALVWNGSAWACSTLATASVTSVGLAAPTSDFTVSGSPVTGTGTLGLKWNVAPASANTANAIVKRDASGSFSAGPISAVNTAQNGVAITATDSSVGGGTGLVASGYYYGVRANASVVGVVGQGDIGVEAIGTSSYGLMATSPHTAVIGSGQDYGVYGVSSGTGAGADGVHGATNSATASGVAGVNNAGGDGVYGAGGNGVIGTSGSADGVGVGAYNSSTGDALFAENQSGGFAAFFLGDVDVDGNLSKAGGSFKIDHPLDPSEKYLYHSFVESPDMKNIYDGKVTTDAQGNAVVTMPDWFEALNRDFRYQLTVIGQFAQAIVADEIANGRFTIKSDKPNVKVSWQVTGIRQDAWADAHRIPVEQLKPEKERGSYLHPELFGAPPEKSIAWARHPETMKRAKERQPLPAPLRPLPASSER